MGDGLSVECAGLRRGDLADPVVIHSSRKMRDFPDLIEGPAVIVKVSRRSVRAVSRRSIRFIDGVLIRDAENAGRKRRRLAISVVGESWHVGDDSDCGPCAINIELCFRIDSTKCIDPI